MQEVRIKLETVTPMFLGGANQEPEIRSPSIRGQMRYWFRALIGAHFGNDLKKIHEKEDAVFGSTEKGSSFSLRAVEKSRSPVQNFDNITPDSGKGYLLWTAKSTKRAALPAANTKLDIIITSKSNSLFACASMWLLTNLGGLGSRSRRGLGSMSTIEAENWPPDYPPVVFAGGDYSKFISDGIKRWQELGEMQPSEDITSIPEFDFLHPNFSGIYIGQSQVSDWDSAIENLGNLLKEFRGTHHSSPDHDGVLSVIKGSGQPSTVTRAIFGLPMQFYYRSFHDQIARKHLSYQNDRKIALRETRGYATAGITPSTKNRDEKIERRASPIHFKIAKVGKNSLITVATFFESKFLPREYQLRISPGAGKEKSLTRQPAKFVSQPRYDLLKEFFNHDSWQIVFGGDFKD